jgi:two-component system chemotaxis sensor kinase CheA
VVPVRSSHVPAGPLDSASIVGTVRVPAGKLDTFLARSGELLVARRRVEGRARDVTALRESLQRWHTEWRAVEKPLAELLREDGRTAPTAPPRSLTDALNHVGDRLSELDKGLDRLEAGMKADGRLLKDAAGSLDEEVRRVRLLPFAEACQGLDRMVRDLAQAGGKEVALVVEGGSVELDRSILEGLKDPLRHLVRNAVDHGAETPAERRAAGKSPLVHVTVSANLRGGQVEVVVADDGRGIDLEALRQQLRRRRLPEPADDRDLAQAVFLPGLSTTRLITDVSGRGVGLDVVKARVEAMHGNVVLSWVPGRGTCFTLAVPLTLTTLRALLVRAGGHTFAFVAASVLKLVRVNPAEALRTVEGRRLLTLGGPPLPVASLAEVLGLASEPAVAQGKVPAIIVAAGDRQMAFLVDDLLDEQGVVIKGLGARIRRLRHVVAATLLPSGEIALVLNTGNLIRTALARRADAPRLHPAPAVAPAAAARKRILVVDDSITTRTLERSILEAAGYEVEVAADGAAAWQLLQEHSADLILSDVDMPRMDGFALTEAVRASPRFHELPVILVTARESQEDRARGSAVGADAYLGKSAFDQQNLLATLAQLVGPGGVDG